MPALPAHGAESRETAPRAVCASFAIPVVAMCIPSEASPLSIASSRINLLGSLGVRSVLLPLREQNASGRDFARACHEATVAYEARTKTPVNAIFVQTSPNLLWTQPLWPHCFYKWDGSRSHGHFHWYARADADTLLLSPGASDGASTSRVESRPFELESRAFARAAHEAPSRAARPVSVLQDPLLAVALPLPPSETECRAFQNATPAHASRLGCPPRRFAPDETERRADDTRRLADETKRLAEATTRLADETKRLAEATTRLADATERLAGHAAHRQLRDGPRHGSSAGSRVVSAGGASTGANSPFLYTTSTASTQRSKISPAGNGTDVVTDIVTDVGTDAASCRAMARAVCTTLEGKPSRVPRLALGLGGLARTFAHQLVYQTVRGHLIDAVGARTTVFAHLRLEDDRPVQRGGHRTHYRTHQAPPTVTSPTPPTPTAAEQQHHIHSLIHRRVVVALEVLGAAPDNVELVGSDGMLMNFDGSIRGPAAATVDVIRRVPDCEYIRHPRVPPRSPCDTYINVCALPTALGQVNMGLLMASDVL
jgi:hypothetical protein